LQNVIFITGTDTGVGKTVLTALLLSHLRQGGSGALALKPFYSGGRFWRDRVTNQKLS
jgi:dethiobiotin synthetase